MKRARIVRCSKVVHVRDEAHAAGLLCDFLPELDETERRQTARDLADGFAMLVVEDDFELLDAREPREDRLHPIDPLAPDEPPPSPTPRPDAERTWIEIRCVTPEGVSYAEAPVRVRLPDGSVRLGTLDDASIWAARDFDEPGTCHFELLPEARPSASPSLGVFLPDGSMPRIKPGVSVGLVSGRQHTLVVESSKVACVRLIGMNFALNKAFILPEALEGIRLIRHMYEIQPTAEMLVVGHTDSTGYAWRNRSLSLQRAQAVVAYLHDDVDHWLELYSSDTDYSRRWGKEEDLAMLKALPFGEAPFYADGDRLEDAIRRFQSAHGLAPEGQSNEATRRALITDYMAADGTTLPEATRAVPHGCGEAFPRVETGDGVEELENRRVEVFFFRDGIDPPPPADTTDKGSTEYPAWVASVEEERTFRPSAAGYGTLLLVTDIPGELAGLDIEYRLFSTDGAYDVTRIPADGVSRDGQIELLFEDMPRGSFYTLEVSELDGVTSTVFDDVPYPELGRISTDLDEHAKHPMSWDDAGGEAE